MNGLNALVIIGFVALFGLGIFLLKKFHPKKGSVNGGGGTVPGSQPGNPDEQQTT